MSCRLGRALLAHFYRRGARALLFPFAQLRLVGRGRQRPQSRWLIFFALRGFRGCKRSSRSCGGEGGRPMLQNAPRCSWLVPQAAGRDLCALVLGTTGGGAQHEVLHAAPASGEARARRGGAAGENAQQQQPPRRPAGASAGSELRSLGAQEGDRGTSVRATRVFPRPTRLPLCPWVGGGRWGSVLGPGTQAPLQPAPQPLDGRAGGHVRASEQRRLRPPRLTDRRSGRLPAPPARSLARSLPPSG